MSIGMVLGWKFNHAPGIRTREGEIIAWPENLGPLPTGEQIAQWTAEYEAHQVSGVIAARRYEAEVGGAVWNGHQIHTDRESQAKITAAALMVLRGQWPAEAPWKFKDGFAMLTPQDVSDMADAVAAHVAACYAVEAQKLAALAAGQPVDPDSGWP